MSNLLNTGLSWLEAQRVAHLTEPLAYARGATVVSVRGTPALTRAEWQTDEGITLERRLQDWLVAAAELGALGEPAAGDRITQTVGGASVVWEVCAPGEEWPVCEWQPGRAAWRIHTQEVQ